MLPESPGSSLSVSMLFLTLPNILALLCSSVCRSIGSAERAFKYYSDIKTDPSMVLDGKAHGAVVAACAEAMQREISVVHERKDQYVLLERAFQVWPGPGAEKESGSLGCGLG